MAGAEWTTLIQRVFLAVWLPKFLEACAKNSQPKFWPPFFEAWFQQNRSTMAKLPNLEDTELNEAEPGDEDSGPKAEKLRKLVIRLRKMTPEARVAWQVKAGLAADKDVRFDFDYLLYVLTDTTILQRLQTWFRWRLSKLTIDRKATGTLKTGAILKKFLHGKNPTRLHTLVQKYSTLYYPERVAPLVAIEIGLMDHAPTSTDYLLICKRITKETWEAEDEETIVKVVAALDADKAAKTAQDKMVDDAKRTASQYQQAIVDLPAVLKALFDELNLKTGWSFMVLMGGPYPEDGGSIQTASHHVGLSPMGNNFEQAYPEFQDKIVGPYYEFLRLVYPKDIRLSRALGSESGVVVKSPSPPSFDGDVAHIPAIEVDDVSPAKEKTSAGENMMTWEEEERLEMELDPEADMSQEKISAGENMMTWDEEERLEMELDPEAGVGHLNDEESAFLASLMPFDGDYPMAPVPSTVALGLLDPMPLDKDLQLLDSFDIGERNSPSTSLMLPVVRMRGSESPSPSPSPLARRTALRSDHLAPRAILAPSVPIPSPSPTAATVPPPSPLPPPNMLVPGLGSAPSTPTLSVISTPAISLPRKLVTYSSNATRAISGSLATAVASPTSLKLLANQNVMEAIRDENVEARRAAFAALCYGQQPKPAPVPQRVARPNTARDARTADEQKVAAMWAARPAVRDSDMAQYVREADERQIAAMREGETAREARKASAEKSNAECMRKAEIMAAEAMEKKEKANRLVLENRVKAAAALHEKEAAAKMRRESQQQDQPRSEGTVTTPVATGSQPAVTIAPPVPAEKAPSNDKERRQQEATKRRDKAAEKKRANSEAKKKQAAEIAARHQKIANVAALSAAAKAAAAPAGDINALTTECPQWMHHVVVELKKDGWFGPEWDRCVKAFVLFEIAMKFTDSGSHGNEARPKEIAHWIKSNRLFDKPPAYHDKYGDSCLAWWMHLQPLWRKNEGDLPHAIYACDDGDWGALRKSGKNGLFMVLLSVAWWARGVGKVLPVWSNMVIDIRRALDSMAESRGALTMETSNKGPPARPKPSKPGALKRGVENNAETSQRTKRQVNPSHLSHTNIHPAVYL
ncbi:hypothetical protein HWV62_35596 [Athelia sp. TMB]|nr:hypothetical protein HWV62_35596 [Athelia sp. TMB]